MIVDKLGEAASYQPLHPLFSKAFHFLRSIDLNNPPSTGKIELQGDDLFAIVDAAQGKGPDGGILEYHRRYIDIQFIVSGQECIGWKSLANCSGDKGYDAERDLGFLTDKPDFNASVFPNNFCILFPEDAHAPLSFSGNVLKIVVKVSV